MSDGLKLPDKLLKLQGFGREYDTFLSTDTYMYGGGLYIEVLCLIDGCPEPYTDLTVNIPECPLLNVNCGFVDTNNFGKAEEYIRDNRLGHPTGRCVRSGYCIYPEYEFDMQEIAKYTMKQEQAERPALAKKETEKEAR